MLTQSSRDNGTCLTPLQRLRSSPRASWRFRMARVSILTMRQEVRIGVVCPNIRRLHTSLIQRFVQFIFTVGNGVTRQALHPRHFSHSTTRVLDEPIGRVQLPNEVEDVLIGIVAELSVIGNRVEVTRLWVLSSMPRYGCDRERGAVWACPNNIGSAELSQNLFCCQL